jgi:hypothetical protein
MPRKKVLVGEEEVKPLDPRADNYNIRVQRETVKTFMNPYTKDIGIRLNFYPFCGIAEFQN